MPALDHVTGLPRHVVAQVVEPEFVVRAVGDVGGVLLTPFFRRLACEDHARGHSEGAEDAAHQFALVAREVVVDGHDVDATARDGVQVGGGRRDEGLALTGLHLSDVAEVQGCAAHDLHVEVTHAEGSLRRFAHRGERLGQQVVERLPVAVPLAQLDGLVFQLVVAELLEVVFESVDRLGVPLELAKDPPLADTENLFQY